MAAVAAAGTATVEASSYGAGGALRPNKTSLPSSDAQLAPHRPGTVLVSYASGATTTQRAAVRRAAKATKSRRVSPRRKDTEVLSLAAGDSVTAAIKRLSGKPGVRYAEPDYLLSTASTSDDTYFTNGGLWGMYGPSTTPSNEFGSNAAAAWAQGHTGSATVAVGVIDEGIQFTHPDLAANIWTNPDEIPGNNIDDDSNGYVDDIHGWDFVNGNGTVFDGDKTEGDDTHGTHVAGTIGGVGGNGQGVAGVNWSVQMVSAKFLGPDGGYTSDAVSALDYLRALKQSKGLNIVTTSNSWGGGGYSATLAAAIENAGDAGMLFVAAAGNSASDNDTTASYPSNYACTRGGSRGFDCVIAVASTTNTGELSSFSSFGATTVDIGAPGSSIVSTYPSNTYATLSGTSMATPHVSGAVALCASINPSLTTQQLRESVVNSAKPTESLVGRVVNSGRLDVAAMVIACEAPTAAVSGTVDSLVSPNATWSQVDLSWVDNAANEQFLEIRRANYSGGSCGEYATVGTIGAGNTTFSATGLAAGTTYCFQVRAFNRYSTGTSISSEALVVSTITSPNAYTCVEVGFAWLGSDQGTPSYHSLGDDASKAVTLPFGFTFYGTSYTAAQISSNGFLRLGSGAATSFSNTRIPTASDPNSLIAAWWDDLNPPAGGTIWSMTSGTAPNRQFVATWSNIQTYAYSNSGVTFQAILDEATGDVILQYLESTTGSTSLNDGGGATIGLESANGSFGTQIGYLQKVASAGTAYRCTTGSQDFLTVTTTSLAGGVVNENYSATLAGSGGTAPYSWAIASGSLPGGLVLDPSSGEISGIPSTAGTSTFAVRITDSDSTTATRSLSIVVAAPVSISTSSLPNGSVGAAYSQTLAAAGGSGSYTWAIVGGNLPDGLALAPSTGRISGTPGTAGTFNFDVRVTDSASRTATTSLSITVAAGAPGAFNKLSPSSGAKNGPRNGLVLTWAASSGAVSYEYCIDNRRNGVCNTSWVSVGSATSVTLNGLIGRTTYEWQVRAVNGGGERLANNGLWWKFTTVR